MYLNVLKYPVQQIYMLKQFFVHEYNKAYIECILVNVHVLTSGLTFMSMYWRQLLYKDCVLRTEVYVDVWSSSPYAR